MLKELDKYNGRINWILLYIHRYLRYATVQIKYFDAGQDSTFYRLTGTYAFVIFFIATVYRHMEFGPQNVQSEVWSKFCREDPWTNLLYINNFNLKDVTTEVQI